MGLVMIQCPNTGKAIPTGFDMDKTSFQSSTLNRNSVGCPACGKTHTWDKKDAWVHEVPGR